MDYMSSKIKTWHLSFFSLVWLTEIFIGIIASFSRHDLLSCEENTLFHARAFLALIWKACRLKKICIYCMCVYDIRKWLMWSDYFKTTDLLQIKTNARTLLRRCTRKRPPQTFYQALRAMPVSWVLIHRSQAPLVGLTSLRKAIVLEPTSWSASTSDTSTFLPLILWFHVTQPNLFSVIKEIQATYIKRGNETNGRFNEKKKKLIHPPRRKLRQPVKAWHR